MPDGLRFILITITTQLPLVGVGWLYAGQVRARPLAAALLATLYELAVLAFAFGRKVWTDELEKDAVKATADWVRSIVQDRVSGFRRRYRNLVVQDYGIFNVRGLGLINTYTLKLDQVFVDLRVDPSRNPLRLNLDLIARKSLQGNRPIWDFLRDGSGVQAGEALAVVGPPGCGKTTLLQHVAVTLATNRQRRYRVRAHTPVLLFLRHHVRRIAGDNPPALGLLLQEYFGNASSFPTLRLPRDCFERMLEAGKCMVLLDGLDEVAHADERRAVSAWVDAQITLYPRCRFVLTARPQGYKDAPLQRAHILEVQNFNQRQVRRFVENWYLANETVASGGREDAGVRTRARKDSEDLLRRLQTLPSLVALTANPLLLTMIAMVHRYHGALPGSRVELYAEICEVLLGRWRQARGIQDPLKSVQKLFVLRPLAAHMMEGKVRDITTAAASELISRPLELVGVAPGAAESFLGDVQTGSGLLLEREAGQWSFAHLTFQEYLASAHWLELKGAGRDWGTLVGDSWWHETLRLYAAQGDATPLVRACLEADTVPTLALAADFLDEAHTLDPDTRSDADRRLIADLESPDPARRRLAAEVRLARRLKGNLQRIDERREIDLDYITCAEYQLFLDDMLGRNQYRQPDHWTESVFAGGDSQKCIRGVRAEDAADFCDWLTQRQPGAMSYRLPLSEEAQQYQARTAATAAWCENQGGFSLVGLPPADESAVRRQLAALSEMPLPPHVSFYEPLLSFNGTVIPALDLTDVLGLDLEYARADVRNLEKEVTAAVYVARRRPFNMELTRHISALSDLMSEDFLDASEVERQPLFDFNLALDRVLGLDRALGAAFDRDLVGYAALTKKLALASAQARAVILAFPGRDAAKKRAAGRPVRPALIQEERCATLLKEILETGRARTIGEARLAQRKYVARMLEYAYVSIEEGGRRRGCLSLLRRLRFRRELEIDGAELRRRVLSLYWWLQVIIAREEGRLGAWEGIRIMREQEVEGVSNGWQPDGPLYPVSG